MTRKLTDLEAFKLQSGQERLSTLVRYATYAPSSHNTQPWYFKLRENTIEVLPNFERRLLISDPDDRELYISIGAAAHNIVASAESFGLSFKKSIRHSEKGTTIFFEFETLEPSNYDEKVLKAIITRENNRVPFLQKFGAEAILKILKDGIQEKYPGLELIFFREQAVKNKLIDIFKRAFTEALSSRAFTGELSKWLRPSQKKYRDGMPGYNLGVPWLLSFFLPWMVKNMNIVKQQVKMNLELIETAPVLGIFASSTETPEGWIITGEALEDLFLRITQHNLKMGLFAAPIEIGSHHLELKKAANTEGRPQVFFRLGFATHSTPTSPRLREESVIIE